MRSLLLYYHTARHLRARQVLCRVRRMLRRKSSAAERFIEKKDASVLLPSLEPVLPARRSMEGSTFTFLNEEHTFDGKVDWNFREKGLLWAYNLNYFDFLRQANLEDEEGLLLMRDFARRERSGVGWDPYPTSLRLLNWIQFLSLRGIREDILEASIGAQAHRLVRNIEYHLLGNHFFENGAAILYGGAYLGDKGMQGKGMEILGGEIMEQVLSDGGHFERSPMYHAIILGRVLDCVNILSKDDPGGLDLLEAMKEKGGAMLGWLRQVRFSDGRLPQVNDTAEDMTPGVDDLAEYAERLGVQERILRLGESGYRMIRKDNYELFADVGEIGPDYQPGHAHSDTFSFILHRKGEPLIVDTGVSTYEKGAERQWQRGTEAHNTVRVNGLDQTEVWSGFRVARRAHVKDLTEDESFLAASHTGYERIGVSCSRRFEFADKEVRIRDAVKGKNAKICEAFLHFHPDVPVRSSGNQVRAGGASISFRGADSVDVNEYRHAAGFNRTVPAKMVTVRFTEELATGIAL